MRVELQALQESLTAAIERRVVLRQDYVDQDKKIGQEIQSYLKRIREIESYNADSDFESLSAEIVPTIEHKNKSDQFNVRRGRTTYNYGRDVCPKIIEFLKKRNDKVKLVEIFRHLKNEYDMEFSNRTVAMNRVVAMSPSIIKENSYFYINE